MLLRGVGALQDLLTLSENSACQVWQPDGLTIHAKKWFLGAGFLGAPPISLKSCEASTAKLDSESGSDGIGPVPEGLTMFIVLYFIFIIQAYVDI